MGGCGKGKAAIVTGSGRGIERATALALAHSGAAVTSHGESAIAVVAGEIAKLGHEARGVHRDQGVIWEYRRQDEALIKNARLDDWWAAFERWGQQTGDVEGHAGCARGASRVSSPQHPTKEKRHRGDIQEQDTVDLPTGFSMWLASSESDFVRGRMLLANWDVDELEAKKNEILKGDLLKMVLSGWP
ncbi:hypothetical protein V494_03705 [Pseudogymnoascus sp. VKM F-4513 (FW-928)]|nr:hypothetical protein V494_03705 [Pseudogymnoascus sp. VKM F-4513 (FW-928)]